MNKKISRSKTKKSVPPKAKKTRAPARFESLRKKGVTLQELLIVIGILSIMATAAVYSMSRYLPSWKIRGAANQIVQAMRRAQQLAVSNQFRYKVEFDPSTSSYEIVRINADSSETIMEHIHLPSGVIFNPDLLDLRVCWANSNSKRAITETWQKILSNNKVLAASIAPIRTSTPRPITPTPTNTPSGCQEPICPTATPTMQNPPPPTITPGVTADIECVTFTPSGGTDGAGSIVITNGSQIITITVSAGGKIGSS